MRQTTEESNFERSLGKLSETPASYSGGKNGYPISYVAKGLFPDEASASAAIIQYEGQYHPSGYGTTVTKRQVNADSSVAVELWRLASCE
jgi:hypothetical protein